MPIHIRRGSNWTFTDKVYVWRRGRWLRVYGAYVWTTQFNRTGWFPMFLFEQRPPPPNWIRGISGDHTSANFEWAPAHDPTVIGFKLQMRLGNTTGGEPYMVYPPAPREYFSLDQRQMNWGSLALDNHYTFTVKSYDEFGREGPESYPLRYWTGHPEVLHNNPNYYNPATEGYDRFDLHAQAWHNVAPLGTRTWRHGSNRWVNNWNVDQGIPKGAPAVTGSIGVISYITAYEQVCHWFGLRPPRSAIVVNRNSPAKIMQVTRNTINEKKGTKGVTVMPGWADFDRAPGRMQWAWEAMKFQSPEPGGTKSVFFPEAPTRLGAWVYDWIQMNTGTNALVIADDTGAKDDDGTNYVSFAPANPWQHGGDSWAIQCAVRFQYADPPLSSPYFW